MSDISKIKVSGVEYDIKDIQARGDLGNLGTRVTELEQHGGGVQPDWNQNDSTAADYVKNRPFYTGDPVEIEIIPSTTVTFSDMEGIMAATWPENFDLVVGQTYKVSWDGTDYVCTGILFRNMPVLGNLGIAQAGDDTGEPFIFMKQDKWLVASTESATEHIIGIKTVSTLIVQIDKKYLPEATNTSSGITKTQVRNLDTTKSYSAEEIKEIYQSVRDGTAIYLTNREVITYISYNSYDGDFTYTLPRGQIERIHPVDGVWNFANRETTYPDTVTFRAQYSNYAYIQSGPIGAGGIDQEGYELVSTNMAGFMGSYIQAKQALVLNLKDVPKYLYISANGNGEIEVVTRNSGSTSGGDTTTLFKNGDNSMILKSSTEGSTKKFKITVDDSGTLSATEVTA